MPVFPHRPRVAEFLDDLLQLSRKDAAPRGNDLLIGNPPARGMPLEVTVAKEVVQPEDFKLAAGQ